MSESKNAVTIAIWVAIIGLIGTGIKGVLDNWDKIFPPPPTEQVPVSGTTDGAAQMPDTQKGANPGRTAASKPAPAEPASPEVQTGEQSNRIVKATVTGTVVDEKDQPVAGAEVSCTDCLTKNVAVTGRNGGFTLPFQSEGLEEIHLSVGGYSYPFAIRVNDTRDRLLRVRQ